MSDTINGYWLGQSVQMKVGDKVGLLWTGDDYKDTFAGTEVEIVAIHDQSTLTVRTSNGIELVMGRFEVAPPEPKKHGGKRTGSGRRPLPAKPKPRSVTLSDNDVEMLRAIDSNLSKAIRILIAQSRGS